jgi:hypothetical protein
MTNTTIHHYLQRDSKTLGNLLNKLAQLKRWNEILRSCLGDEAHLMDHCQIVNLSNNSLIVIANSPNWLTRLRFHIPDLLPKLQQHKGLEHIKAICCKAQPIIQHGKLKKVFRKRLKLKPETATAIIETAKKLKDTKIKAILEKIASYADVT